MIKYVSLHKLYLDIYNKCVHAYRVEHMVMRVFIVNCCLPYERYLEALKT